MVRARACHSVSDPAFFIAGAIGVFVRQASVMKYLGARANRVLATGWRRYRARSGSLLLHGSAALCRDYRMGAGSDRRRLFSMRPGYNVLAIS